MSSTSTGPRRAMSERPLDILVVGVSWPMETFIERLLVGLAGRGHRITVAPLSSFRRPPSDWLEHHRIKWTHEAIVCGHGTVARALKEVRSISQARVLAAVGASPRSTLRRRQLLTGPWDVVYGPWINSFSEHSELRESIAPIVSSCRGNLVTVVPWNPSRQGYREGLRAAFDAAAAVHCVSSAIVDDAAALGLDRAKALVIRPAVPTAAFAPQSQSVSADGTLRVIGVGRLDWKKDYELAIAAVRKAVDAGCDLRLTLVGDGPDRAHLRFAVDDMGLSDRVDLVGRMDPGEVAERLADADIFLHTSYTEGISNAVLEAMATGLPVITTDAGGMSEAVRDRIDGRVVPVRDASAVADALVELSADEGLRHRMGASGRARIIADFSLDDQLIQFETLFRDVASGRAETG